MSDEKEFVKNFKALHTPKEPPMPLHEVKRHMDEISARVGITQGAIVTLKTGGPSMVVETTTPDKAYCNWHNDAGDLLRDWVGLVCLKVKT